MNSRCTVSFLAAFWAFLAVQVVLPDPVVAQAFAPILNSPQLQAESRGSKDAADGGATPDKKAPATKIPDSDTGLGPLPATSIPNDNGSVFKALRSRVDQSALADEEKKVVLDTIAQGESQAAEILTKQKLAKEWTVALTLVPQRAKQLTEKLGELTKFKAALPDDDSLANLEVQLANAEAFFGNCQKSIAGRGNFDGSRDATSPRNRDRIAPAAGAVE